MVDFSKLCRIADTIILKEGADMDSTKDWQEINSVEALQEWFNAVHASADPKYKGVKCYGCRFRTPSLQFSLYAQVFPSNRRFKAAVDYLYYDKSTLDGPQSLDRFNIDDVPDAKEVVERFKTGE